MAREECLTEMMADDDISREDAKTMFLKSANKEEAVTRVGKRKVKNKFFLEFDAEVSRISPPPSRNAESWRQNGNIRPSGVLISMDCV